MARKPKPSVLFRLPKERIKKSEYHIQLRVNLSYNRKRHSLSYNILYPEETLWLYFTAIDNHGNYTPHPTITGADEAKAKQISKDLKENRDFLLHLMERAINAGKWEIMTTADIRNFLGFWIVQGETAVFKKNGIFDQWAQGGRFA